MATARRMVAGRSCPECGYALREHHSPLRYIVLPAGFAVFILFAVRICAPVSHDIDQSRPTRPSPVQSPQYPTSNPSANQVHPIPSMPTPGRSEEAGLDLRRKAEKLADEIKLSGTPTAQSLAKALARTGQPEEIKDPELLAAVIYRWVTTNIAYDVVSLNPTSRAPQNPDFILKERQAVCEGYACLFDFLLSQNQVESRIVHGLAKTKLNNAKQLTPNEDGHAWIIVKWGGSWRILEPTWGAGSINQGKFEQAFKWDWFDVRPDVAIYTHIPEEDWMRLLDSRIPIKQIEESAQLNPLFFEAVEIEPLPMLPGALALDLENSALSWRIRKGYSVLLNAVSNQSDMPPQPAKAFIRPSGVSQFSFSSLPQGEYTLNVFARRPNGSDHVSCGSFLLRQTTSVTKKHPPVTFKTYDDLGAQLLEPLEGRLPSGTWQRFAIRAKAGRSLALQLEGESTMNYLSETEGIHETRMLLRKGKLRLWQVSGEKMQALAEYMVE